MNPLEPPCFLTHPGSWLARISRRRSGGPPGPPGQTVARRHHLCPWALAMVLVIFVGVAAADGPPNLTSSLPWQVEAVGAHGAWRYTEGAGAVIAVLDTGLEETHLPTLASRVVARYDAIPGQPDESDASGHGTAVTMVAAGGGDLGVWGIAPAAGVIPIVVADSHGRARSADVATGVREAVRLGANVINLSIGSAQEDPLLAETIRTARQRGAIVVAASGDSSAAGPLFPASLTDAVISVGAAGIDGAPEPTSNGVGSGGIYAPGEHVRAAAVVARADGPGRLVVQDRRGSSMGAAIVSGAIALLWSCAIASGHSLTMRDALALLRNSSRGHRFFNLEAALHRLGPCRSKSRPPIESGDWRSCLPLRRSGDQLLLRPLRQIGPPFAASSARVGVRAPAALVDGYPDRVTAVEAVGLLDVVSAAAREADVVLQVAAAAVA